MFVFDTETVAIRPGMNTPPLVCLAHATETGAPKLEHHTSVSPALFPKDGGIVGHNVSFDAAVLLAHDFPAWVEPIFNAYDEGRVRDTMHRAQLQYIRQGQFSQKQSRFGLSAVSEDYCGFPLDKGSDTWRTRYGELIDTPVSQWPREAVDYPIKDVDATRRVYKAQEDSPDEVLQARGALALKLFSTWGFRVDQDDLEHLFVDLHKSREKHMRAVVDLGIYRPNGKKDMKVLQNIVSRALGDKAPKTPSGKIQTSADVILEIVETTDAPMLQDFAAIQKIDKVLSTYIPAFLDGCLWPINPGYYDIRETGRTSCLAGWTPIETFYGPARMNNVQVGELVLTHKNRWRPVTAIHAQGVRVVFDVHLSNGQVLTCTSDHKLLCSDGRWLTLEDLDYERIKELGFTEGKPGYCSGVFQDAGIAVAANDCRGVGDLTRHGGVGVENVPGPGRVQSPESDSLLKVEDGFEESDAREDWRVTSSLGGGLRRRQRLPDDLVEREATVRASGCDGRSFGFAGDPGELGCPPHRRGQTEQRSKQPRGCHKNWAHPNSLFAGEGQPVCTIEKVEPHGSVEVFDLTVEEDESFNACGIFVHNCREPNIQNLPREMKLDGKKREIRTVIKARPGTVFVACDWSAAELVALAQVTYTFFGRSAMRDAINDGFDLHTLLGAKILGRRYEDVRDGVERKDPECKNARQLAKIANFGYPGGLGAGSFVEYCRGYGVKITPERGAELKNDWRTCWPEMVAYLQLIGQQTSSTGPRAITQLGSGRVRGAVSYTQAANSYFQGLVADAAKDLMWEVIKACFWKRDTVLADFRPIFFVHDEIIGEAPEEKAHEIAMALQDLFVRMLRKWCPDVKTGATAHLMRRWTKAAEAVYDDRGRLIPWEDRKR